MYITVKPNNNNNNNNNNNTSCSWQLQPHYNFATVFGMRNLE